MRSTGKCDIMYSFNEGICFMKTKIIYISGNEVFDIADIRSAFEEVRSALNLDKTTVLFGVPVDGDDAGFATQTIKKQPAIEKNEPIIIDKEIIPENKTIEKIPEISAETVENEIQNESVVEHPIKKRGRPRKEEQIESHIEIKAETTTETPKESTKTLENETIEETEEKVVPILSVLSNDDEEKVIEEPTLENVEIIPDINEDETQNDTSVEITNTKITDDDEEDLEKLLSAMTPLEEDTVEIQSTEDIIEETQPDSADLSVDATLEQLATEFVENQDKIAAESKTNSRSKISKLRSILPFKQSKHKDQGLGDLFGWAGIAANDEEFSVPGFFTSAAGKK